MHSPAHEHSTRFIMDESSPYLANMAALWAVDPNLAGNIEAMESIPSYALQPSRAKAGEPTLVMTTESGREILMHSRHDPIDEAKLLIDRLPIEERAAF